MDRVLQIEDLKKVYADGLEALKGVDLSVQRGEIFALLGPNGAGKTTLINVVCGIVTPSSGKVLVDGRDHIREYRAAREKIGLVPQELTTDAFESVSATVRFSRGLFGKSRDDEFVDQLLSDLSLLDKRDQQIMTLSGGMKRRVMIAKALSHEPQILFLDEPTAGVDVELRRDMWEMVRSLRQRGVTIILTTHYIEEAEEMADRVGVINDGNIIVVDETASLMEKLGEKTLTLKLTTPLESIPVPLREWDLVLGADGHELVYKFDANAESTGVPRLLRQLIDSGLDFHDLHTQQSSLEDIFVNLVKEDGSK